MVNWLSKFKFVTRAAAVGVAAGASWVVAHPEITTAVARDYPQITVITTAAGLILALFHTPKN